MKKEILLALAVVVMMVSIAAANEYVSENKSKKVVEDEFGIVHKITFVTENSKVRVETKNPTEWTNKSIGYIVEVDGQRVYKADLRLDRNEQRTQKINITPGINVNQDNHTVAFYTYGNSTQFNFTRKINSTNPGDIPTPYIADVEVTNGTIDAEPSAVANVTLVNPSKQLYSTKLMVHTVGTDGSLYPASVRPESSRTITVELLDDRGAEIAGEARLYTGNMTTTEGAMDQVEFAGQAEEQTQIWNRSYEPVRPTWMKGHYQYENASYSRSLPEKLSAGHEVEGIPIIYAVVVLLVGWMVVRKVR